jgi:hypothetical protein
VYSYNLTTHTNNGLLFTIPGSGGLATIAYDGTNLWIGDYSSNRAFLYTLTGTLIRTITLANTTAGYDGLEYFVLNNQARLIANRGDAVGPYDLYDTNGNLITASFINPGSGSVTGISFDGTNFFVSKGFSTVEKYNGTTGAFISSTAVTGAPGGFSPLIEDMSADYSVTLPGGGGNVTGTGVPTLSEWGLIGLTGLLMAFGAWRVKASQTAA